MVHDLLDETLLAQLPKAALGEGSTDLQPFRDDRRRDQLVGWHLLVQLVIGGLIEQDLIVQLIANLSFRPLLLLGLAAGSSLLLLLGLLRLFRRSLSILLRRLKTDNTHHSVSIRDGGETRSLPSSRCP